MPCLNLRQAEAGDDVLDLALADGNGGDLGVEVAPVLLGHAHIGAQDLDDILVQHAAADELARRDADAFLLDLGQRARERSRDGAADVRVVDVAGDEADELAVDEDGLPDVDVGRVGARPIRYRDRW